jgi:hypothetical protein
MYCNAKLWPHKAKWRGMCCCIILTLETWKKCEANSQNEQGQYAAQIHNLWKDNTVNGKLLHEFARPLNNALALASQIVEGRNTLSYG